MKRKMYLLAIISMFHCCENTQIITQESKINREKIVKINVPENYEQILQADTIFEQITALPLETNKKCLISYIRKVRIVDGLIYVHNERSNLFVFSSTGQFIREVGRLGRGPGEFIELRDFDIDNEGNIYLLDYSKILKYSKAGGFLEQYQLNFDNRDNLVYCNPLQFSLCGENYFYVWGGTVGIDENPNKNLFLMYKITKKGDILERYFPIQYNVVSKRGQFSKYSDYYNLVPWFGSSEIYKAYKHGVSTNYQIDFGNMTLNEAIPNKLSSLGKFKERIDKKYAHSVRGVIESNNWLYCIFSHKKFARNLYYSKDLKKAFVSKIFPRPTNRIVPWMIHALDGGDMIALIEPRVIFEDLANIKEMNSEVKAIKEALKGVSVNDNHILLRCKMKTY